MCCTVVFLCVTAGLLVNLKGYSLSCGKHSGFHTSDMTEFTTTKFDGIFYYKFTVCCFNYTAITFLSTHGSVEWCLFYKYSTFLTFHQRSYDFFFSCENCNLGIISKMIISLEFSGYVNIDLIIYSGVSSHIVGYFTCGTCFDSLFFHCFLEAFFVDSIAFFFKDLFGKVKWKSVSIIQFECIFSGKSFFSGSLHLFLHVAEDAKSLIDSFVELIFFVSQNFKDEFFLFFQFRISGLGTIDHFCTEFCEEASLDSQKTSMTCCTTDQTAEYVSTSLIGRHDTIRDHKCSRADMVCDQTDGYIILIGFPIFFAGNLTYQVTKCTDGIYVKDRINILYNNSQTFKAHTCINIFLFQSCIISVAIVFELSEYIVPYFHVTVAVTTYGTARFATTVFFPTVIIDFRTWATWTCTMFPEIIFFTKTENSVCWDSDFFIPDIKSLIIVLIHRWIKSVCIQTDNFCQKFPGPVDCFCFEVISKREITKHLKECTMTCCFSNIFDITGTNTFLTCGDSCSRWFLCTCEIWFQWSHTCIDQQEALVSLWYQGKAFHYEMSFTLHEIKEHLTKFVYSVFLHDSFLLKESI